MSSARPITIVGGGLAGLALGIGLRQRGVPVTLWEAGNYPRHRVCGEFISGRGAAVLDRLGLLARCRDAGAFTARTAMFICGAHRSPARQLPAPALCLSRHVLDELLAQSFAESGGDLRLNQRQLPSEERAGWVLASGRRPRLDAAAPRWFGVKAHDVNHGGVTLAADLEMHLSPHGYVGINRIGGGEINVCGLFQARDDSPRPESKLDWLRGAEGSPLRDRLRAAQFDPDSFCSVAGLELNPGRATDRPECCLGDALTMTPPVTGNGMSMAFESAEMAIEPLAAYSDGSLDWAAAKGRIARACDAAFARRLAWARRLQWMMMSRALQVALAPLLLRSRWLWRVMFERTR